MDNDDEEQEFRILLTHKIPKTIQLTLFWLEHIRFHDHSIQFNVNC